MLTAALVAHAQGPVDPFRVKQKEAVEYLKKKDYDTALRLYSEAIELFPKTDEFTPKLKTPLASEGNLSPGEYRGLDALYMGRFWVYLGKNETELAQADLNRSLIVLDTEKKREYKRARSLRSSVSLERERKIENPHSHNSELIRSAFLFNVIGQSCSRGRSKYTYSLKKDFGPTIPEKFLLDKTAASLLLQLGKTCEAARFGEAEAFATSAIELNNRSHAFNTLKLANELVQSYPQNGEAYRLRSKVNRFLGNEQQAILDDQKVRELVSAN